MNVTVIPSVVATSPPSAAAPRMLRQTYPLRPRYPRLRALLGWTWRIAVGALLCFNCYALSFLTSIVVVGWSYRWMQALVLRSWWRRSGHSGGQSFADFCAALGRKAPAPWPRWFLRERCREWLFRPGGDGRPPGLCRMVRRALAAPLHSLALNFRLGLQGLLAVFLVTCLPCALMVFAWEFGWLNSFHKGREIDLVGRLAAVGAGLFFALVMIWVPMAQAHQAATGEFRAFFDLGLLRRLIQARPGAYLGLTALIGLLSLPLELMKTLPAYFDQQFPFALRQLAEHQVCGPLAAWFITPSPGLNDATDAEVLSALSRYLLKCAVVLFLAVLLARWAAARVYAGAVLAALRRGAVRREELHPRLRGWLELLELVPRRRRRPAGLLRTLRGSARGAYLVLIYAAIVFIWVVFFGKTVAAEFFNYHPVLGFMNHPLIHCPCCDYVPTHLAWPAAAAWLSGESSADFAAERDDSPVRDPEALTRGCCWPPELAPKLRADHRSSPPMRPRNWKAGLAQIKITPEQPLLLAGYSARNQRFDKVIADLYVKALVLEDHTGQRAAVVTSDLLGLPAALAEPICARIEAETGLKRAQILLNSSDTHSGPLLSLQSCHKVCDEDAARLDAYTRQLQDKVVQVVAQAAAHLRPVRLAAGEGIVHFVMNRRQPTSRGIIIRDNARGPADRSVPVLRVTTPEGQPLAVLFGVACHGNVLLPDCCGLGGDFPGIAQAFVQEKYPGAQAMYLLGCGGDARPHPRGTLELCQEHGQALGKEVCRVLETRLRPIEGPLRTAFEKAELPLQPPPTRAVLEGCAKERDFRHCVADEMLFRLDKGEQLPSSYSCPFTVWQLGDDLTLVGLPGQVVVDYVALLGKALGPDPLWIAGNCNDAFGYLPSARILEEGGHEARGVCHGGAGIFDPKAQDVVMATVRKLAQQAGRELPK